MGRHKEWRKLAKQLRRKRIRSAIAEKRNEEEIKEKERRESSPSYKKWFEEQEALERFAEEEELRLAKEQHILWEQREIEAQQRWHEKLSRIEKARAEKVKQELLIREEWDREQKKIKEEKEQKEKEAEEKRRNEETLLARIDDFISGKSDLPSSLLVGSETQPGQAECPFFSKTGACRFRSHCSRNHIKPGISRVLLFTNFYDNFLINTSTNSMNSEYDTDVGLEYEDSDTYHHFLDFYDDILPEFESCGKVRELKVCCNYEAHLRGNVYVEYYSKRFALKAYRLFQGRFYGGRQLSVSFINIPSWKNALCGLFWKNRCPKGRTCNFLHTFRNPHNAFRDAHFDSPTRLKNTPPLRENRTSNLENCGWSDSSDEYNEEYYRSGKNSHKNDRNRRSRSHEWENVSENRRESTRRKRSRKSKSRSRSREKRSRKTKSSSRSREKELHKRKSSKNNSISSNKISKTGRYSCKISSKHNKKQIVDKRNSYESSSKLTPVRKKSDKEERTPGS